MRDQLTEHLRVWGITAMILSELLAVLEADLPIRAEAASPGPPPDAGSP